MPNTVGYLRFKDYGVQGICTLLLQKLRGSSKPGLGTPTTSFAADDQFWMQRKQLGDTDILKKIWSGSQWCIWIRPTEFKKARFQNLDQCRSFVGSSRVEFRGSSSPYPWFSGHGIETGTEWVASEIETDGGRLEWWVLFRSGQFVHRLAIDRIPQLGKQIHVLTILDTSTAAFEFAARMANKGVLSPQAAIRFDLLCVDGRQLTWPTDSGGYSNLVERNYWCQDENIALDRVLSPEELQTRTEGLALEAALEIYSRFRWSDPPIARLQDAQRDRFGNARQWRN